MNYVSPDLGSGVGVHLVEKNRVHFGPFQTFPYTLTWSVGGGGGLFKSYPPSWLPHLWPNVILQTLLSQHIFFVLFFLTTSSCCALSLVSLRPTYQLVSTSTPGKPGIRRCCCFFLTFST